MSMYQNSNTDTPFHQFTTVVEYLQGAGFVSLDTDHGSIRKLDTRIPDTELSKR